LFNFGDLEPKRHRFEEGKTNRKVLEKFIDKTGEVV